MCALTTRIRSGLEAARDLVRDLRETRRTAAAFQGSEEEEEPEEENEDNAKPEEDEPAQGDPDEEAEKETEKKNEVVVEIDDNAQPKEDEDEPAQGDPEDLQEQKYEDTIQAIERLLNLGTSELLVQDIRVVERIFSVIKALLDPTNPKLEKLPELLVVIIKIYGEHIQYTEVLGDAVVLQGSQLKSLAARFPSLDTCLGHFVEEAEDPEDQGNINPVIKSRLKKLNNAVWRHDGGPTNSGGRKILPTIGRLTAIVKYSKYFNILLRNLGNLCVILFLLLNTTVKEILPTGDANAARALRHEMEDLARKMGASDVSVREMTLFKFLQDIALPALARGEATCMEGAAVICAIMWRFTGAGQAISSKWKKAEDTTVFALLRQANPSASSNAGSASPNATDAANAARTLSGAHTSSRDARSRAVRTALVLVLEKPLALKFPDWGFGGDGYTSNLLLMAPTEIMKRFRFLKKQFFVSNNLPEEDKKKMTSLATKHVKQAEDLEKVVRQTLLIENEEQLTNMLRLYSKW